MSRPKILTAHILPVSCSPVRLSAAQCVLVQEWMSARPDVVQAKEAIHQNPAGALAPVPLMGLPQLLERLGRQGSQEVCTLFTIARCSCKLGWCRMHPAAWNADPNNLGCCLLLWLAAASYCCCLLMRLLSFLALGVSAWAGLFEIHHPRLLALPNRVGLDTIVLLLLLLMALPLLLMYIKWQS